VPEVDVTFVAGVAASGSGTVDANVVSISGDATAADNAEAFFDGTGYAGTNNVIPTVTTVNGLAANVITAAAAAADFGTEIGTAVWATTTRLLTAGTNINGSTFTAIPWAAAWDAEVQSEVQDAIEANHLDHLLAADYDPASKPGVATALLNELVESDSGVSRYTANALEQGPSGGGGGSADWTSDEKTAIRTILGIPASGTTPEAPTAGALKTIDDFLDSEIGAIQTATDRITAARMTVLDDLDAMITAQVFTEEALVNAPAGEGGGGDGGLTEAQDLKLTQIHTAIQTLSDED
jgi:hypothetical protein